MKLSLRAPRGGVRAAGVLTLAATTLAISACQPATDSAASSPRKATSVAASVASGSATSSTGAGNSPTSSDGSSLGPLVPVISVIDGDTIAVRIDGARVKIRLIGVDTPETRKPNTPVQCFGKQASSKMQSLVQSRSVRLQADPTQGDRDKYDRSLRYVFTADGVNVAQTLIAGGFGREYTYAAPYRFQKQFRSAQVSAKSTRSGLWGACPFFGAPLVAATPTSASARPSVAPKPTRRPAPPAPPAQPAKPAGACIIKGNISSKGEKIYHVPGGRSYDKTKITLSKGERWFCSESDAVAAGWRAARD
ncbi:thermonuclease family protein [Dermatophilaceae bacterium Sec6.4]